MIKKPILLHYYLTNRCNSRCSFCDIWKEQPKIDAKIEDVLVNLCEARHSGCRFVDFTGGEPLLHNDLRYMLVEAKKLGYITSVTTNTQLFPKKCVELSGLIDLLHFSLDGGDAETHNNLHGVKSFDTVIKSIELALNNNLTPDIHFTYSQQNIATVEKLLPIIKKYKLILILDPLFSTDGGDPIPPHIHKKALELSKRSDIYLNKAHLLLRKQGGNSIKKPICKAVSSTIVIIPENKLVFPCYHHYTSSLQISKRNPLSKLLKHPERLNAQKNEGVYPFCDGCSINCYFDPSFLYKIDRFFILTIVAKLKYTIKKYFFYGHKMPQLNMRNFAKKSKN